MVQPMDTSYAKAKTEVRMTYDNDYLYIAAINYSPKPGKYIVFLYFGWIHLICKKQADMVLFRPGFVSTFQFASFE